MKLDITTVVMTMTMTRTRNALLASGDFEPRPRVTGMMKRIRGKIYGILAYALTYDSTVVLMFQV